MPTSLHCYITALKNPLTNASSQLSFADTLAVIDAHYNFTPTAFKNGSVENSAGANSGSCKVFSFAQLHKLTKEQTLLMFAEHYRNVLDTPSGDNHANIRGFMETGFSGLSFDGPALKAKSTS